MFLKRNLNPLLESPRGSNQGNCHLSMTNQFFANYLRSTTNEGKGENKDLKSIIRRKVKLFAKSHRMSNSGKLWLFPGLFKERFSPPDGLFHNLIEVHWGFEPTVTRLRTLRLHNCISIPKRGKFIETEIE